MILMHTKNLRNINYNNVVYYLFKGEFPIWLTPALVFQGSESDIRRRREAYQEELRKQIEEKKRIEAEEQEKEQRKEAAIARRAELQRERMRQEYIKEESLRRERHLQRYCCCSVLKLIFIITWKGKYRSTKITN